MQVRAGQPGNRNKNVTKNHARFRFRFFDTVFEQKSMKQVNYPDYESAYRAVKDGEAWGVIRTPANFSKNLLTRLWSSIDASEETLNKSSIRVRR